MSEGSLPHLLRHHRDFSAFRDAMVESAARRFGPLFWAVFNEHIAPGLGETGLFVDFGTGPGTFLELLRQRAPRLELLGVDCQPQMLETARARAQVLADVRIVEADLARGPISEIGDATVAAALASMVLHELPVPTNLLREARRVLRPGGRLLVYDWIRHPLREYTDAIPFAAGEAKVSDLFNHFSEHCRYTADDLVFLAEQCGFSTLEVMTVHAGRHAILVMERAH